MTKPVSPFMHHHAKWNEALSNLSSAHEAGKNATVGHVHQQIVSAADASPGMDPEHVGGFLAQG